ncbi:P-loop containing nucleoside triphosphate hydrolase protein [Hyaloscypha variabilis]
MKRLKKIVEKVGIPSRKPLDDSKTGDESVAEGPEKIIIFMGPTGSGKSRLINTLTNQASVKVGHGLESLTSKIEVVDWTYKKNRFKLVDTPGFDDTYLSPTEILTEIAMFLRELYERKVYVNGILYLYPITNTRVTGSILEGLAMMRRLVGENSLKNVILVTTFWDKLRSVDESGLERERQLREKFWEPLIYHGARIARSCNNRESALNLVNMVLISQRTILDLQRELVDEKRALLDTAAGKKMAEGVFERMVSVERRHEFVRSEILDIESKLSTQDEYDKRLLRDLRRDESETKERLKRLKDELALLGSTKS